MADVVARDLRVPAAHTRLTMQKLVRRKSTIAFFMSLPLILVVACLVVYPAFYSISLAMMNKSMQHFVGFGDPGDIPIVGDWNGDGIDTIGVVRGNTWYLRNSNTTGVADVTFTFGDAGDRPSRVGTVDPRQRRERGVIEAHAHANTEHHP